MKSFPAAPTALSVNVNKVALLRNSRHLAIPSPVRAAQCCLQAGAAGITIHPRPDQRHIRTQDAHDIAALMKQWPEREFNIEGNPFHNLMPLVRELRPQQCTLVPDSQDQFTSDHGWRFPADAERLMPIVAELRALGVRVSLFMDPDPRAMAAARAVGADRVELYTESYARAWGTPDQAQVLQGFVQAGQAALQAGLGLNAGHDLSRENLPDFLRALPQVLEVSIGHAFMADALEMGYADAVRAYQASIAQAFEGRAA
jgi:pyridoxine 5-phosphate synthase